VTGRARGLAAAALASAALLAGCGGDDGPELAWSGQPDVLRHPEIARDVLATGQLRNRSDHARRIASSEVRVLDSAGHRVKAAVIFAVGYSHSLYAPGIYQPKETPLRERERLGQVVIIPPGGKVPLTIAWHRPRGGRVVRIEIGGESLPVPPPVPSGKPRL
jgi:hypothetical protein